MKTIHRKTDLNKFERLANLLIFTERKGKRLTRSSIDRLERIVFEYAKESYCIECLGTYYLIARKLGIDTFQSGLRQNKKFYLCPNCNEVEPKEGSSYVSDLGFFVCENCLESGEFVFDKKNEDWILWEKATEIFTTQKESYYVHENTAHRYSTYCSNCHKHYDDYRVNVSTCNFFGGCCEFCSSDNFY